MVVIGILLALQVNNWNDHRQDRLDENVFLSLLRADLEIDNHNFQRQIDDAERRIASYIDFVEMLHQEQCCIAGLSRIDLILPGWK